MPPYSKDEQDSVMWQNPINFALALKSRASHIMPTPVKNVKHTWGYATAPTLEFLPTIDWQTFGFNLRLEMAQALSAGHVFTWKFPDILSRRWAAEQASYEQQNYIKKNITRSILRKSNATSNCSLSSNVTPYNNSRRSHSKDLSLRSAANDVALAQGTMISFLFVTFLMQNDIY